MDAIRALEPEREPLQLLKKLRKALASPNPRRPPKRFMQLE